VVRRIVVAICVMGLFVFAASPADARKKKRTRATTTLPTTTTLGPNPRDRQAAAASLLQASELIAGDPAQGFRGYQQPPPPSCTQAGVTITCPTRAMPDFSDDGLQVAEPDPAFPACTASIAVETNSSKYRTDGTDIDSNGSSIGNSIYVFPTVDQAKAYVASYATAAAKECFQHSMSWHPISVEGRYPYFDPTDETLELPDFDPSTVPQGSVDEGVGFDAIQRSTPGSTSPGTQGFQDVRYRAGRAVIFLRTFNGDSSSSGAYFPGVGGYLAAIADRLTPQLK
jgi:hypothetical protein